MNFTAKKILKVPELRGQGFPLSEEVSPLSEALDPVKTLKIPYLIMY
jgi:hypothetical protein